MTPEMALYEMEKDPEQPRCDYCSRFMAWDTKPTRRRGAPPVMESGNDPWNWQTVCERCEAKR